jgi:hypothetical protein
MNWRDYVGPVLGSVKMAVKREMGRIQQEMVMDYFIAKPRIQLEGLYNP